MMFGGPLDGPGLGALITLVVGVAVMVVPALVALVVCTIGAIKPDKKWGTETELSYLSLLEQHRDRCLED